MTDELIHKLGHSPLFQLSLSSKELFHSNFLFWLANAYPEAFNALISDLIKDTSQQHLKLGLFRKSEKDQNTYRIGRENKNYDFSIKREGDYASLIIENKVKSVPYYSQLLKYYESSIQDEDYNNSIYILLSLVQSFPDKSKIEDDKIWHIVSYEKLANSLENAYLPLIDQDYHRNLITDYIHLIRGLHGLAAKWEVHLDENFFVEGVSLRGINDLCDKIRFSSIINILHTTLKEKFDSNGIGVRSGLTIKDIEKEETLKYLYTNFGFTKGSGLIEIKVKVTPQYVLGIQIQGKSYRRLIEKCFNNEEIDLVDEGTKLDWWFIDDLNEGDSYSKITSKKTKKYKIKNKNKGLFLQFDSSFKYQYRLMVETASVKSVVEAMIADIDLILTNIGGPI